MGVFKPGTVDTTFPSVPNGEKDPPWVVVARGELGQHEVAGPKNNPRILEYHKATELGADMDSVAWCSSFVSWCLERAQYRSTKNAWAQSYTKFGKDAGGPKYGCIVVFKWSENSGHVGFCVGIQNNKVLVLGGNQSDSVSISPYAMDKVVGFRWPYEKLV